ncbi:unnamed protein product [Closterium sp. NIES-53]
MVGLVDEVFVAVVEEGGVRSSLKLGGSGHGQVRLRRRGARAGRERRRFARVIGCGRLESLRTAKEDVKDAVGSEEGVLKDAANAADGRVPVDGGAICSKLQLVNRGSVDGRWERNRRGGGHDGWRRVDSQRPRRRRRRVDPRRSTGRRRRVVRRRPGGGGGTAAVVGALRRLLLLLLLPRLPLLLLMELLPLLPLLPLLLLMPLLLLLPLVLR